MKNISFSFHDRSHPKGSLSTRGKTARKKEKLAFALAPTCGFPATHSEKRQNNKSQMAIIGFIDFYSNHKTKET